MKDYNVGAIISADLTTSQAGSLKNFYEAVIGWKSEEMQQKDGEETYPDYVMKDDQGNWVTGVCHARGVNIGIPPVWMVYINVADISESIRKCTELGGKIIKEARTKEGELQYAMIQDPAGAILAVTKAG